MLVFIIIEPFTLAQKKSGGWRRRTDIGRCQLHASLLPAVGHVSCRIPACPPPAWPPPLSRHLPRLLAPHSPFATEATSQPRVSLLFSCFLLGANVGAPESTRICSIKCIRLVIASTPLPQTPGRTPSISFVWGWGACAPSWGRALSWLLWDFCLHGFLHKSNFMTGLT